jgi:chloramphenicol-sensitive protein RarD
MFRTRSRHFQVNLWLMLLLIGAGVVTSIPLLWFNNAAKRLRLSTLRFFQYIAPGQQLLLGIFLYRESFSRTHAVTFGLIWLDLITYSTTSFVKKNQ